MGKGRDHLQYGEKFWYVFRCALRGLRTPRKKGVEGAHEGILKINIGHLKFTCGQPWVFVYIFENFNFVRIGLDILKILSVLEIEGKQCTL